MPIVQLYQDPLNTKDIKINNTWDVVITREGAGHKVNVTGENNSVETFMQILSMCLKTKMGTYLRNRQFGCSPRGQKIKMTKSDLADLRSYIQINLNASYFNQKDYPITVSLIPIGLDTVAISVSVFFPVGNLQQRQITFNALFSESTQEVKTIFRAFGE